MSKHVLVVIVAVLLLMPATVVAQPIQWEAHGHFYEFVESPGMPRTSRRDMGFSETLPTTPVITYVLMLTAHADKFRLVEAFECGADDSLPKPFD